MHSSQMVSTSRNEQSNLVNRSKEASNMRTSHELIANQKTMIDPDELYL